MYRNGLVDEVRAILAAGVSPEARPLQAIGYRQALEVVAGRLREEDAVHETAAATVRYAKRQRTWFRHQTSGRWFEDSEVLAAAASSFLSA
jgi:tRNA dimethylallyltransferase